MAAVLVATLVPAGRSLPRGWSLTFASSNAAAAEIVQNLLLFVPLGLALALAGVATAPAAALGAALSVTVEVLQQWIPGRDPSVGDIVCNTLSTALGVTLARTAPRWLFVPPRRAAWQALAAAGAATGIWLALGWLLTHPRPARALTFTWIAVPPGGHTMGDGWRLVSFPKLLPDWMLAPLDAVWLGACLALVGYWVGRAGLGRHPRHPAAAAAVIIALGALVAVPALVGLRATPLEEWVGAVAGLVVGWGLARIRPSRSFDDAVQGAAQRHDVELA